MKTAATLSAIVALAQAHATFQQLWKNGEDLESSCARLPATNSPVETYTGTAMQCNANPAAAKGKCSFAAGDTVTIEMHQQFSSRDCKSEGIGGAHWGPVLAYLSKVDDAATADGSGEFFKIYENGWKKNPAASQGDQDYWGTKDINYNCGKLDFNLPKDLAAGDYLLRAEAIALHAASSSGGAQHYMTCYQLTVTGSGTVVPKGVKFPEAYSKTGPGLGFSIHTNMDSYPMPGPALISSGTEATPQLLTFGTITGSPSAGGGSKPASSAAAPASSAAAAPSAAPASSMAPASSAAPAGPSSAAAVAPSSSAKVEAVSSAVASKTSAAPQSSTVPEPEESDCPAESPEPEPEEECPADEPETPVATPTPSQAPQPSGGASAPSAAPAPGGSDGYPANPAPTTMATSARPAPTEGSTVGIKEWAQCGGQGFSQGGECGQGLQCKQWNPYYSQCVKAEGGSQPGNSQPGNSQPGNSQPGNSQPGGSQPNQPAPSQPSDYPTTPTPAAPQPSTVVPEKTDPSTGTEKTYTLKTFIAWLEENAGSASAEKIRRMIEALQ